MAMSSSSKVGVALVILALVAAYFLVPRIDKAAADSRSKEAATARAAAAAQPMELLLARLDGVETDKLKVARLRDLLGQLSARFGITVTQVGDQTYTVQRLLREKGIAVGAIELMDGVNQSTVVLRGGTTYAEFLSYYLLLREKSFGHQDSIDTIALIARKPELRPKTP